MKNNFILIFSVLIVFVASCRKVEKDPLDYYPKVKTVAAVIQADGSVLVTGEIIDEGADVIEYGGFSMDTFPIPEMLSNQVISYFSGNIFTAVYENFDISKTYYFRSWAANEYGYSLGNVIALDSITATPVVAPCNPVINSVNYGGLSPTQYFTNVPAPSQGFDTWDIIANTSQGTYTLKFGASPVTKIYTTTLNTSPGPNEVRISFYSGFTQGALNDGSSFYVNQVSPGNWTMILCNAPWQYSSGSTLNMNMNLTCPL